MSSVIRSWFTYILNSLWHTHSLFFLCLRRKRKEEKEEEQILSAEKSGSHTDIT